MLKARIFYDSDREALFIDTVRDAFPPRTLQAQLVGDVITIMVAYSDIAVFSDVYSNIMTRDRRGFDSAAACLTYLDAEFSKRRQVAYEWTQEAASALWHIAHNLGFKPNVMICDTTGQQVLVPYRHLDLNTVEVEFAIEMAGTARLS